MKDQEMQADEELQKCTLAEDAIDYSAAPPEDEEDNLGEYLEKYIDGYLIQDLDTLIRNVKPREQYNCSFVIILTICTGIEFLGALLRPALKNAYSRREVGNYFGHYWKHYLSKIDKEYDTSLDGRIARDLIRNGLAHHFIIKPGLGSVRSVCNSHLKFSKSGGVLVVDADRLFEDFKKSYQEIAKPKLLDGKDGEQLAKTRLKQILDEFKAEKSFHRLTQKLNCEDENKDSNNSTTTLPPIK